MLAAMSYEHHNDTPIAHCGDHFPIVYLSLVCTWYYVNHRAGLCYGVAVRVWCGWIITHGMALVISL